MNGRIETYTHSDASLQNKCGSIVCVTCQSEQGAKTEGLRCGGKCAGRMMGDPGSGRSDAVSNKSCKTAGREVP